MYISSNPASISIGSSTLSRILAGSEVVQSDFNNSGEGERNVMENNNVRLVVNRVP